MPDQGHVDAAPLAGKLLWQGKGQLLGACSRFHQLARPFPVRRACSLRWASRCSSGERWSGPMNRCPNISGRSARWFDGSLGVLWSWTVLMAQIVVSARVTG